MSLESLATRWKSVPAVAVLDRDLPVAPPPGDDVSRNRPARPAPPAPGHRFRLPRGFTEWSEAEPVADAGSTREAEVRPGSTGPLLYPDGEPALIHRGGDEYRLTGRSVTATTRPAGST